MVILCIGCVISLNFEGDQYTSGNIKCPLVLQNASLWRLYNLLNGLIDVIACPGILIVSIHRAFAGYILVGIVLGKLNLSCLGPRAVGKIGPVGNLVCRLQSEIVGGTRRQSRNGEALRRACGGGCRLTSGLGGAIPLSLGVYRTVGVWYVSDIIGGCLTAVTVVSRGCPSQIDLAVSRTGGRRQIGYCCRRYGVGHHHSQHGRICIYASPAVVVVFTGRTQITCRAHQDVFDGGDVSIGVGLSH